MEDKDISPDVILDVANEVGLRLEVVEGIIGSVWKTTKKTMEQGEFRSIRIPYFGSFNVKPFRLWAINNPEKAKLLGQGFPVEVNLNYKKKKDGK